MSTSSQSNSALNGLRFAYHTLEQEVIRALNTQLGDAQQLGVTRARAVALLEFLNSVSNTVAFLYCLINF